MNFMHGIVLFFTALFSSVGNYALYQGNPPVDGINAPTVAQVARDNMPEKTDTTSSVPEVRSEKSSAPSAPVTQNPTGPPTCYLKTTSQSGQMMEYRPYANLRPSGITVTLPETVTFTWSSTNATAATGPKETSVGLSGTLTMVPDKISTYGTAYFFVFTGPYGKAVCQANIKVVNPVTIPDTSLMSFKVEGNGGGGTSIPGSTALVMYLPSKIANTLNPESDTRSYGFSYELVPVNPSGGKSTHFDNRANASQEQNNGPVEVSLAGGLPSVSAGTYKVVVSLYYEHTDPHGFDILRTLIGKGESEIFTLP